ncbi:hypothetical protein [Mucilaginibacter gilvus]|uniref:Carboxypeptidase-like regulatory domain-containing protein n=1 Tax=Mucilaginibacter gilvus TaxID=2305909 RepID=A0A3S4YHZ5_9SPHI|nr:hypothetical protein [Mucilaginibacter gilvus]RWY55555.1 hypothetical protein EPL05_04045 [Mucilaginibacter gilvus]
MHTYTRYFLLFAFCLAGPVAFAQGIFNGKVFEYKTRIGLANIWIENLRNKQNTLSDKTGKFSLPAKPGDLVLFKGFSYKNDTVLVTSLNSAEIFLQSQKIELKQVNISTTELAKKFKDYDQEYHGQPMVYHRDREGNLDGGINIRIHYWKKGEHDKAKLDKKLRDFETMDHIHGLFTPETIGKFVPLKGDEMDNFISLYTPSVKVFTSNDFNMVAYLSESYKKYQALPVEKRHPQPIGN